jgi:hypothetical protein
MLHIARETDRTGDQQKKQNGKKTKTKQFRTLSSHFTAKILRCFRKLSFAAMTRAQRARKGNGDVKNYPNN